MHREGSDRAEKLQTQKVALTVHSTSGGSQLISIGMTVQGRIMNPGTFSIGWAHLHGPSALAGAGIGKAAVGQYYKTAETAVRHPGEIYEDVGEEPDIRNR